MQSVRYIPRSWCNGFSRSRSCRWEAVETEWRSQTAHARKGKRTVSSQAAGEPVNRDGSVSFFRCSWKTSGTGPWHYTHRRPCPGVVSVFSRNVRRTCARLMYTRSFAGGWNRWSRSRCGFHHSTDNYAKAGNRLNGKANSVLQEFRRGKVHTRARACSRMCARVQSTSPMSVPEHGHETCHACRVRHALHRLIFISNLYDFCEWHLQFVIIIYIYCLFLYAHLFS